MPITVPVRVIGWKPAGPEPPKLRPQFDNPVPVRVYAGARSVGSIEARLEWDGEQLLAHLDFPHVDDQAINVFCIAEIEHEPISGIRRRRVTSIDVKIERA